MSDTITLLKENIKKAIKGIYDVEVEDVKVEHPDNEGFGDYSTNVSLSLAKQLRKLPFDIAQEISQEIHGYNLTFTSDANDYPIFSKIEAVQPGFINFTLSEQWLKNQLFEVLKKKDNYGSVNDGEGKIVIIEFSQPNPNKPMHIGHSRNNFLGSSLSEIFIFAGFNVVKMNYMNDWGTHVCKPMLMYKKYKDGMEPDIKSDHFVGGLYRMYEDEHEKNPADLERELAGMFKKLEEEDKETLDLWKKITGWVYEGWKPTYENENVSFDVWEYQSKYTKSGKEIVDIATRKGIAEKDPSGAVIARLEKYGIPDKVLLRSDGTSIYVTQDTQLAKDNYEKYNFEKRLYVVDKRQSDYFRQLFKILELLDFDWAKKLHHVSYGWVSMPEGAMSSRSGFVVNADDIFEKLVFLEREEIENSLKEVANIEDISKKVALAAYRYGILKVDPKQDIVFDLNKVTKFEGNTGPYLMYTYARARSILEKSGVEENAADFHLEFFEDSKLSEKEESILRSMYKFSEAVTLSAESLSPHILANYLYDLAQRFNSFYGDTPVLNAKENVREFRLVIVHCVSQIIKNGLGLLGIDVVERM